MLGCTKISTMRNRDLGRIHAEKRKNRPKQFQTENGSQQGGYVSPL
jgi:hypothetical protein